MSTSDPRRWDNKTLLLVVGGVIAALVVGGVIGALIRGAEADETETQTSLAVADASYAALVQQYESALREYAATASAVQNQQQARRAQATLRRQEARMEAVAAEAARYEEIQRARGRIRAAERSATLILRAQAAKAAAQRRREAAVETAAATVALRAYGEELGALSASIDRRLMMLEQAETAAEFLVILDVIAEEIEASEEQGGAAPPGSTTPSTTTGGASG